MAKSQDQCNVQFWGSGIDICNFADDATPYVCVLNLKTVLETLEHNSEIAIAWFETNYMKLNTDKGHLLISDSKNEQCGQNWIDISFGKVTMLSFSELHWTTTSNLINMCLIFAQRLTEN